MISLSQLHTIIPKNSNVQAWYNSLTKFLPNYNINTTFRIASFLSQCLHESENFTVLSENLNYNSAELMKVWPHLFYTLNVANQYQHNPQKIANLVYANRMGNGNESTGDGYLYRGRGIIQITGKANYQIFARFADIQLADAPKYLETTDGAVHSACWFWNSRNINNFADKQDVNTVTKLINGGLIGLSDRAQKYEWVKGILN